MQRGLEGRRVALYVGSLSNGKGTVMQRELEAAGAQVHVLTDDAQDGDFHGGVYAALVAESAAPRADAPVVQLIREFMASDKPVAFYGDAVAMLLQAGGAAGRRVASDARRRADLESAGATPDDGPIVVDDALITATGSQKDFAASVVREFANRLEDRAVDEMSDLSFPASDPPAVSPSTLGSTDSDART
ncbi:MAG TPA: DJ-1/PfpI family protein [Gemmatimonadaceae bacterium]|nr:DJ-1/PfpI family protein [Gemmatimonadaceae bacterium]